MKITKPTKYTLVTYLYQNSENPIAITMRIYYKQVEITHHPISLQKYSNVYKEEIKWINEYNVMDELYYLKPQIKLHVSQPTSIFIQISSKNHQLGGKLYRLKKNKDRLICDGDDIVITDLPKQYEICITETILEEGGDYVFVPHLYLFSY